MTIEIDEARVRGLHEDREIMGDVEDFVIAYQDLIDDCLGTTEASEQRIIKRPSEWGKNLDKLLKTIDELDFDLQGRLDERHRALSGRSENFFGYVCNVVEPIRRALHDDIEKFKDNGRYRRTLGKDGSELVWLSNFCVNWEISVKAAQGTFFELASLVKSDLGTNWDIYKLPERMNKIYPIK